MKLIDNIPVRLSIVTSIYIILLIFISPFIDHLFTPLEDYEKNDENNIYILCEIVIHVVILSVFWYYLNKYLQLILMNIFHIKVCTMTKTATKMISGIALVGLQRNLIHKLNYITYEHPFRQNK